MADKGKASTRAKNKYNAKNYDRLAVIIPTGVKEQIKAISKKENTSVNDIIIQSINMFVKSKTGMELILKDETGKYMNIEREQSGYLTDYYEKLNKNYDISLKKALSKT
jgi:hypothetical protein